MTYSQTFETDTLRSARSNTIATQTRLTRLMTIAEQSLLLVIWLVLIMGLFFPWENFVSPQGDALGDQVGQQGFGVSHACVIIFYISILSLALLRLKGVLKTLWLAWPILILCGWILLSVTWGPDPSVSLSRAGRFFITVIFSAYMASRFDSKEFVRFLTGGFGIIAAASIIVMILVPNLGHSNLGGGYENAWRGAFTHKNWLGAAMSLGTVVTAYSYIERINHRFLSALTCLACLFLLVMSRSATAMIGLFASAAVAVVGGLIQSRRTPVLRAFALIAVFVGIAILILLPLLASNVDFNDLPSIAGRSATLTGRTDVWRAVWSAIHERSLIGHGYGFWDQPSVTRNNIRLAVNWEAPHAHNNWLDAWLQLGLVGVTLTAFIWLSALRRAISLIFARYGGALLYLTILFNCLARSTVETVTFAPALVSLFWWVISYMYIAQIVKQKRKETRSRKLQRTSDADRAQSVLV
jgi:exopolysaccharide production protein ExoQ